jgi:hypothetical protein
MTRPLFTLLSALSCSRGCPARPSDEAQVGAYADPRRPPLVAPDGGRGRMQPDPDVRGAVEPLRFP